MITKKELAEAFAYNDAETEEHLDLADWWRKRGIDIEDVMHVVEQRGLRLVMLDQGLDPNQTRPIPVRMTTEERIRNTRYAALVMDGLAAGIELARRHGSES